MGTKDKLIERFKRLPKDFTYEEVVRLLKIFGYTEYNKGRLQDHVCVLYVVKAYSLIFISRIPVV